MKRSDLGESKLTPNFIGSWIIDYSLCDEIIAYYEKNKQKQSQGVTSGGMNLTVKDRRDITLTPKEFFSAEDIISIILFAAFSLSEIICFVIYLIPILQTLTSLIYPKVVPTLNQDQLYQLHQFPLYYL